MEKYDIECALEGILFVSGDPVAVSRIASVLDIGEDEVEYACDSLRDKYSFERRGIRLVRLENSYQLCSSPQFADCIRRALETKKMPKLSQPALEVLAIIAYFQPTTKAYIESIRGVDSVYTVSLLQDRGLIEPCGRLQVPGRPVLFKTTQNFLRIFGLESLADLPDLPPINNETSDKQSIQKAISEMKANSAENGNEL